MTRPSYKKAQRVTYTWQAGRAGYIHVADMEGSLAGNDDVITRGGDGAYILDEEM